MIKKLARYIGEYKKYAILAPSIVTLDVIMDTIIPLLMAMMIDQGISAGDMWALGKWGSALLIASAMSLFLGVTAARLAATASTGFAKNLRRELFYKIQDFSFSNIDKFSPSGLITRLTTDVTNVQNAFQMMIRITVRAPLLLITSLIFSFGINARLSLVFFAVVPILGIGLYFILTKANPIFRSVFKLYDKLNLIVQENLRGIRVVKSYVREDHEISKFKNASGNIYTQFLRAERIMALNSPLMQFCMYGCTILFSWFGAKMIASSTMTTGQLTSLLSYAMQVLMSLMMISMILMMLTMARASAERIAEVLDENSDIAEKENPVTTVPDASVSFESVGFSYKDNPDRLALKEINLHIKSGSTVGIIGGTGSGKTTLVQLIPRLYDATCGVVKVGGIDVKDYHLETLRDKVSMVLQKNVLFSGTIKENLRWGNKDATDEEMLHACQMAAADEFIQGFPDGYDTYIEQGGANLSGGQKQRLCIARALLKKPMILIFDDSTSAVDTKTEAKIRKAIKDDIPNTTKIIIAQRISSVQEADQIVVMDRGRINAVGTHQELLETNTIYKEVYESQTKGGKQNDAA